MRRLALVTGAGSGIGRATALRLATDGFAVLAVDKDDRGQDTVRAIADAGGEASFARCDVGDPAAVEDLARRHSDRARDLHVLANVVGGARIKPVLEMDFAWWQQELHLNLHTVFLMTRTFLPWLVERRAGVVVSMSSGWGFRPAPGRAGYSAAKAALLAFSRSLAAEVAPRNVRVNVVAPGATETPRMRELTANDDLSRGAQAAIPLGRLARPEDVAGAVAYLASDDAAYITGQVIHVNGGLFMS